jgi:RNA recognition motif-containing protein
VFVEYETRRDAFVAYAEMHNYVIDGKRLKVEVCNSISYILNFKSNLSVVG